MIDVGPLWSEREGRSPSRVPLTTSQVGSLFASLIDDLFDSEHLQEAFGKTCIDDAGAIGTLGSRPEDELLIRTGRDNLYPVDDHFALWGQDELLDAFELYGHLVSTGDPGHPKSFHHDYNDCGWHFGAFIPEPARSEYRSRVNPLLARYEAGFTLNTQGQIERLVPELVDDLSEPPPNAIELDDEAIVQSSIRLFRSRDFNDRRASIKGLADVLEPLRSDVRDLISKADERALFEIANKFWIRHNDLGQKKDYDHESWWDWIFQVNLASIRLLQQLKTHSLGVSRSVDQLIEDLSHNVWHKGDLAQRLDEIGLADLPDSAQHRIGVAVGRRCVGQTVVVTIDGLEACAASTDINKWPEQYRVGLLHGLFLDDTGRIATIQSVQKFVVQLLLPLGPDGTRAAEFATGVADRAFASSFAPLSLRTSSAKALLEASTHLPRGTARDAWEQLANRLSDVPAGESPR